MASKVDPAALRAAIVGAMFIADAEPCSDRDGYKCCNYCKATYVVEAVLGMLEAAE
jgi:hypothetical protein